MRHVQLPQPVDLITCHFDALNYLLSARDLQKALGRFRANLTQEGYAIFDMVTDVSPEPQFSVRVQRSDLPGVSSISAIAWDPARQLRVVTMHNVFALGTGQCRHEREVHTQRPYPVGGVVALLVRCGFHVCGVLDAMSLARSARFRFTKEPSGCSWSEIGDRKSIKNAVGDGKERKRNNAYCYEAFALSIAG
jgi:hypothetical protein